MMMMIRRNRTRDDYDDSSEGDFKANNFNFSDLSSILKSRIRTVILIGVCYSTLGSEKRTRTGRIPVIYSMMWTCCRKTTRISTPVVACLSICLRRWTSLHTGKTR